MHVVAASVAIRRTAGVVATVTTGVVIRGLVVTRVAVTHHVVSGITRSGIAGAHGSIGCWHYGYHGTVGELLVRQELRGRHGVDHVHWVVMVVVEM